MRLSRPNIDQKNEGCQRLHRNHVRAATRAEPLPSPAQPSADSLRPANKTRVTLGKTQPAPDWSEDPSPLFFVFAFCFSWTRGCVDRQGDMGPVATVPKRASVGAGVALALRRLRRRQGGQPPGSPTTSRTLHAAPAPGISLLNAGCLVSVGGCRERGQGETKASVGEKRKQKKKRKNTSEGRGRSQFQTGPVGMGSSSDKLRPACGKVEKWPVPGGIRRSGPTEERFWGRDRPHHQQQVEAPRPACAGPYSPHGRSAPQRSSPGRYGFGGPTRRSGASFQDQGVNTSGHPTPPIIGTVTLTLPSTQYGMAGCHHAHSSLPT